jgi:hypothetical protein
MRRRARGTAGECPSGTPTAPGREDEQVTDREHPVARRLRWQAHYCRMLGSPFYGELLERAAGDVEAGGPTAAVVAGHEDDPTESMIALRLMGAVHRLVLGGEASELQQYYPSVGGRADANAAWPALRGFFEGKRDRLRRGLEEPVQTNEVSRSAALVVGFLEVARRSGLPLRTLEVGASAGLNLLWDHWFYSTGEESFGPAGSPLRFTDHYLGSPPFDVAVEVIERRGCDPRPLDACSPDDRLTLAAYVWPDQEERLRALRSALVVVCREGVEVERADGPEWVEARLAEEADGKATVVYHSLVLQYLPEPARNRLTAAIERSGDAATEEAPLAWLRMEPGGEEADLRLRLWPGGADELIATAGYQGRPVRVR